MVGKLIPGSKKCEKTVFVPIFLIINFLCYQFFFGMSCHLVPIFLWNQSPLTLFIFLWYGFPLVPIILCYQFSWVPEAKGKIKAGPKNSRRNGLCNHFSYYQFSLVPIFFGTNNVGTNSFANNFSLVLIILGTNFPLISCGANFVVQKECV